jgi:hypothetical protein
MSGSNAHRSFLAGALTCLAIVAAGCGGVKSPSVASLGTAPATTGTSTGSATLRAAAAFASCMSLHGLTAAVGSAASAPANGLHVGGVTFNGNVDPSSPQFQTAMQACRKYLPGGGPPPLTPAQQAEWAMAMAKFAACMRKDGVPDFPNPELGKPPARSGADPSSPLVQSAFKACQSLEPKVGPRIAF